LSVSTRRPHRQADLDENTSGRMKLSRAHNSCKLFWRGVPVIKSRPRLTNVLMICERSESTFLIRWASSMMIYSQLNFRRVDFSLMHISYDVIRISNFWARITSVTMLAWIISYRVQNSSYWLTRSSLVPWSTVVLNPGTHFSTSLAQLFNVDLGTTIKWGPAVPWWNFR